MNGLRIGGADYKTRQARAKKALVSVAGLLIMSAYIILTMNSGRKPDIVLEVQKGAVFQDEEIPELKVSAVCNNSEKLKEALEEDYTVEQLVKDLNSGKGCQLEYEIDNKKEGSYPVKIILDKKLKKKIDEAWNKKIKVEVKDGVFQVKNKYGTWEGKKFKRLEGSYVTSDFVVSKGEEYYFDQDGKMVTGEQIILNEKCVFGEDGKLISRERVVLPDKPMIALTFDDGPGKYTEELLNMLDEYNARATFFMLGSNVEKYPEIVKRMKEMGCELGNHSWSHTNLLKLDDADVKGEIDSTNAAISAAAGQNASQLRPPFGAYDDRIKSLAGMPLMIWSVDTRDWERKNAAEITEYVLNTVEDGDVVLMHDIHSFSVESAIELIPELTERGFQLVTISEMAEARGISLEAGARYAGFYKE